MIIRGPRPRSVQWPRATQQSRPIPVQSQPRPGDPHSRVTAVQERVVKLEAALVALHSVEGPEIESLRAALKRAKDVRQQPLEGFLSRARAHLE